MPDETRCVVSLGVDSPSPPGHPEVLFQDFSRGLARIREDLQRLDFSGDFLAWDQRYPKGSPTQEQAPYAYKPFCLDELRRQGHGRVLWLDASIRIKKPLEPLFEIIEEDGYLIFEGSHSVGEYCKDEALETLGITREASFEIPACRSCVLGLDLNDPISAEFLRRLKDKAVDGITFPGPKWSGIQGWPRTVSMDPRVKGHRHDQTAASVIALELGMDRWRSKQAFREFFANDRSFVRRYQEYKNDSAWKRAWRSGRTSARQAARAVRWQTMTG